MSKQKKKIGLFFGSFNPVHIGHMIIASYLAENTDLAEVWMVVSPQNPLKKKESLAKDRDRLYMINLAIDDNPKLRASDVEFSMPKPSYTIDTLTVLKEKYPDHKFVLIMGSDNLPTLHRWKNYERLIEDNQIYVYTRPGYEDHPLASHKNIRMLEAPLLNISATFIRKSIKAGKSIRYMVPEPVFEYLDGSNLYK